MNLMQHLFHFTRKEDPMSRKRRAQKPLPPPSKAQAQSAGKAPAKQDTKPATKPAVKPSISTPTTPMNKATTNTYYTKRDIVYPHKPKLTFSPYAWAKMLVMRDKTSNEVGAFGITLPDKLLHVYDLSLVKQEVTGASVSFDDDGVADFTDTQIKLGRKPTEFMRIWIHTHPGDSPGPSMTDYETFNRVFGVTDWSVMFILAQGGKTSCELRFNVGPKASMELPIAIDYSQPFPATDFAGWKKEYEQNVTVHSYQAYQSAYKQKSYFPPKRSTAFNTDYWNSWGQQNEYEEAEDYEELAKLQSTAAGDEEDDIEEDITVCDACGDPEDSNLITTCQTCDTNYCLTCFDKALDTRGEARICMKCNTEFDLEDAEVLEEVT